MECVKFVNILKFKNATNSIKVNPLVSIKSNILLIFLLLLGMFFKYRCEIVCARPHVCTCGTQNKMYRKYI